jgi:predicted cobalt transporter CbtA
VYVKIKKNMEEKTYVPQDNSWRSCCFTVDRRCAMFLVQSFVGFALLTFSAVRLTTETDCDRSAPYWGLIGTISGFFFNKLTMGGNKKPVPTEEAPRAST